VTRAVLVVLVALALVGAGIARADGDPASDYLYTQKLFLPFDVKVPIAKQGELASTIEGATKAGFPIRVAIIGSPYDLGAVPDLWRKPREYARFLGIELEFVYRQRLLIVMPNGFGFFWREKPVPHEYALLRTIAIKPGAEGLVDAAQAAVTGLAADAGVDVKPVAAPKPSSANRDRVIIVAAVALIALAGLARFGLRRRHRQRP
jgi:hypothetical protein